MKHDIRKTKGIHYTPPALAAFLATVMMKHLPQGEGELQILDPACGGGVLLAAACQALPRGCRRNLSLFGFETDRAAIQEAKRLLSKCSARRVDLKVADFLSLQGIDCSCPEQKPGSSLRVEENGSVGRFDAIIANPPYVRTQVLGARRAQALSKRFRLTGRVDLYQAFVKAMANALKPGGVLGLLTSNRFLTVKSGAALRHLLRSEFCLEEVYDMGDTKLFEAAVLPVILVARKQAHAPNKACLFARAYELRNGRTQSPIDYECNSILDALLDRRKQGVAKSSKGIYRIERGTLSAVAGDDVWSLSTPESDAWLKTVRSHRACVFDDLGSVRVGIKTTADRVFLRDDWDRLPSNHRPESSLLRPVITHFTAARWVARPEATALRVLYPHVVREGRRAPIDLEDYPKAARYFQSHRERLERRKYLVEGGRRWYEIWVPHHPADWKKLKIVFPDISESPRFFLDRSGAIVNGDCYWITLKAGVDEDWMLLMLAVANSRFITQYYDVVCHNKLYAGRRRFMTQYVKDFPLPHLESPGGRKIVRLTSALLDNPKDTAAEEVLDRLVWNAFGVKQPA